MKQYKKDYLLLAAGALAMCAAFVYFWFCGYEAECWWCLI